MIYTREALLDYSVSKLIDIILNQQEEATEVATLKKKLARISSIINEDSTSDNVARTSNSGRPRLSDEEREARAAERYEKQKAYQRAKYAMLKAEKEKANEEDAKLDM